LFRLGTPYVLTCSLPPSQTDRAGGAGT